MGHIYFGEECRGFREFREFRRLNGSEEDARNCETTGEASTINFNEKWCNLMITLTELLN
jgi:hypothetical protein